MTARSKTIDTLSQKLRRDTSTPLQNVQDIAGVRFEAEMTLDEQDKVAAEIARLFGHGQNSIHDGIRTHPHSGYRAVHVWLRLSQGRVEVQVRTTLQGVWANAYESAADLFGREIRYGEFPSADPAKRVVTRLHELSAQIAQVELLRNRIEHEIVESIDEVKAIVATHPDQVLDTSNFDTVAANIDETKADIRELERRLWETLDACRATFEDLKRKRAR